MIQSRNYQTLKILNFYYDCTTPAQPDTKTWKCAFANSKFFGNHKVSRK